MRANQQKSMSMDDGEVVHKITYTQGTKITYDEAGLRKALGAKKFDSYTNRVLDKPRFRKAVTDGELDQVTVAKYIQVEENAPFVKYTLNKKTNEEWEKTHGQG